jgi:hypothetical protein
MVIEAKLACTCNQQEEVRELTVCTWLRLVCWVGNWDDSSIIETYAFTE